MDLPDSACGPLASEGPSDRISDDRRSVQRPAVLVVLSPDDGNYRTPFPSTPTERPFRQEHRSEPLDSAQPRRPPVVSGVSTGAGSAGVGLLVRMLRRVAMPSVRSGRWVRSERRRPAYAWRWMGVAPTMSADVIELRKAQDWKVQCGRPTKAGTPCKRWCAPGFTVCAKHGATLPSVKKTAALTLENLRTEFARLASPALPGSWTQRAHRCPCRSSLQSTCPNQNNASATPHRLVFSGGCVVGQACSNPAGRRSLRGPVASVLITWMEGGGTARRYASICSHTRA